MEYEREKTKDLKGGVGMNKRDMRGKGKKENKEERNKERGKKIEKT